MDWDEAQIARFDRIIEREFNSLLRKSSTEYNFSEVEPKVKNIIDATTLLKENADFWEQLPQDSRDQINTKLDQIATIFDQMRDFDPKQNDAWSLRNDLISRFNAEYREIYSYLIERIQSYLGHKAYSKELTSKFSKTAKSELDEIRRTKKEIDKVLVEVNEAKTTAGDVASTATASYFDHQAKKHSDDARKWFWGVIGSSAFSLLLAILITTDYIINFPALHDLLSNAGANALALVVLAFSFVGIKFCIRNYSANKHLYVANIHRANALKSMEAFRTSASDENSKNAILLGAVNTAYGQVESGYITTKEGAGTSDDGFSQIIMALVKKEIK